MLLQFFYSFSALFKKFQVPIVLRRVFLAMLTLKVCKVERAAASKRKKKLCLPLF